MIIFGRHRWQGETGRNYLFDITLTDRGVPEGGGVYIFVRRRFVFFLTPLYVGKAASFRSRVLGHERWNEAWYRRGATERHFLSLKTRTAQARVEEDLIREWQPVMNDILVPRGRKDAPNNDRLRRWWRPRHKAFFGLFG